MNTNISPCFANQQDLFDQVINQLAVDFENRDFTAIEELLSKIPNEYLIGYLPEEQ